MTQSYLHWDVFTGERFFGNQLAVFTDARGLDTATMQRITREMNFSESTFILPAESPGTDVRMRIFTPTQEMPMAGHPTIGSTFCLAHTGVLAPGRSRVVFGLNVGPTPVDLEWRDTQLGFAWMTQGLPQFGPALQERALVASTLGLGVADLMDGVPIQTVSCGFPVLLVPIRDREAVDRAVSDAAAFRRLTARLGQMLPVFLFTVLPPGGEATVYSRLFAPEFGIIEDPATGGATGPLGCYLVQHGLVGVEAAGSMLSLQGVAMGRRSRLHISIDGAPGAITGVRVGGEAVLVGRGELYPVIAFSRISKQYGRQVLFVDASFQLNAGEKVGLVGPNGAGKTTLFRMIVGEETADDGEVTVPKRMTVGYFRQDVEEMTGRSVLDEAIAGSGRVGTLHHELEELQRDMADPAKGDQMDRILDRFGTVQEEYDHLGGYGLEAQAREVLHGLGFDDDRIDGDVGALSGGWKMRVAMARVLLGRPDVLLMDEPTNHLDIESIIWLEGFLASFSGALLMTSHDRSFMNRVVSRIAEIDDGEITAYSGNYDFYERERAIRETNREAAYARQQAMLAKEQRFIERFAAHAAKAAQVQSRVKALDKIEKIELPKKRRVVAFDFRQPPRSGDQVAVVQAISKAYGKRVVYDRLSLTLRRGERWCVMGKNGAGKSTLLKMVAGASAPDDGEVTIGASVKMGYFAQQALDILNPDLTVEEQLQQDFPQESVGVLRTLAGAFQFSGDEVDKKVRSLSGGEKTRLALARLLLYPPNFLVLDEPTNHLDLFTKEMLIEALRGFEGTMLFVSHDRSFLRALGTRVLEVGGETGTDRTPLVYPGTYVEYVERTGHEAPGVHL